MPAIRDSAIAYAAAATTVTVPLCDYAAGDLLIIFIINDQASTYTTPTSGTTPTTGVTWNVVSGFPSVNTVQSNAYWKIAAASETDVSITGTGSDSQCMCMISIRDVDQTNPFGSPVVTSVTTHTAVSRYLLPTITTNRADSLVLYFSSSGGSSTSAPPLGVTIVENKANELLIVDGTGEGFGVGWLMQRATGASPNNIYAINPAFATYGVGSMAALQICGPSGGATVIPPYLVSDASQLLDLNAGTVAFDGNTAMAATADTAGFGTSITVAGTARTIGDATVAATTDVGINTFHSMAGLTNAASAYMSGAQNILSSARYNIGTRNILGHLRNTTPANNQRLAPVPGNRGAWMGIRSGTTASTNYKIWQVHGADAPWAPGSTIPVIINIANTDHIASAGTVTNSDVRNIGWWVGGLGALTTQLCVGPMWAMGTTVLAGGNASEPFEVDDIVKVAAIGKERLSAIQQGAKQVLLLQDIQLGDGGTNSIYLNIDSAAIEFPSRKSLTKKTVFYNGIDDSVGLTYYPGASDTIIHKNSVISSANKFKWGLHASASTSATYDFSGTAVIGAGTIFLGIAITLTGLTINGYGTLDASNLTLTYSNIKGVPATNASITTNASTNIDYCDIDVTGLTASQYWWSGADPSIFTYNNFIGDGAGHAINCTAAGGTIGTPTIITLQGNTFTGFGADASTGAAINFTAASGYITLEITGGGSTPTYKSAGAIITVSNPKTLTFKGFEAGTDIVVNTSDTNTALLNADAVTSPYAWAHNYGGTVVDIKIIKAGKKPISVYDFTLPNADQDYIIAQELDRNYV